MGLFKKLGKKVGGAIKKVGGAAFDVGKSMVKGAIKDAVGRLPGANMISGLVSSVMSKAKSSGGSSGSSEAASAQKAGSIQNIRTTNVSSRSAAYASSPSEQKPNIIRRFINWMKEKKSDPKGAWIFWLIVAGVGLVVVIILYYIGRAFGLFRKSSGRSYVRRSRTSKASPSVSRVSTRKRSGLSPKQRAALAKGRAALARKRRK